MSRCPVLPLPLHVLSRPSPQMTYSLTRFAIYETVRDQVAKGSEGPLPFYKKVLLGAISGEWGRVLRGAGAAGTRPGHGSRVTGHVLGLVCCQVASEASWGLPPTWSTSGQWPQGQGLLSPDGPGPA